jgi:hypothetical protein
MAGMRQLEEKVEKLTLNGEKQDKCFNFKFSRASRRHRSAYQSDQWVVTKIAKIMAEGTMFPRFARLAALRLQTRQYAEDDKFDIVVNPSDSLVQINPSMPTQSD